MGEEWEREIQAKGSSRCKGPEALACFRKTKRPEPKDGKGVVCPEA